jgi:hypothetical protein
MMLALAIIGIVAAFLFGRVRGKINALNKLVDVSVVYGPDAKLKDALELIGVTPVWFELGKNRIKRTWEREKRKLNRAKEREQR